MPRSKRHLRLMAIGFKQKPIKDAGSAKLLPKSEHVIVDALVPGANLVVVGKLSSFFVIEPALTTF